LKGLHKFLNWYTQHFPFPKKGWKYGRRLLAFFHLQNKTYIKKLSKRVSIYVTPVDHIQQQLFWYGYYEREGIATWQTFINNDSIVVDVGANIGLYSLAAATKLTNGKVYAFEPVAAVRQLLEKNISLNQFTTIVVVPFSVSNTCTIEPVFISAEDNLGMSGLLPPENFSGKKEWVQSVRLDDWAKDTGLQKPDLIKIDVEGAELNVLTGMQQLLQRHQPIIFIEMIEQQLKQYGHSAAEVYQLLNGFGYQPYFVLAPNQLQLVEGFKESYNLVFLPAGCRVPPEIIFV